MPRKFNTIIRDKHFQKLHHALGCPWPEQIKGETYRNYFAAGPDSDEARRMAASPHWTGGTTAHGHAYFYVTDEGRAALYDYIMQNIEVPRRYAVSYRRYEGQTIVIAKTTSAARYAAYNENEIEWPFIEFANEVKSIRIYDRGNNITRHAAQSN